MKERRFIYGLTLFYLAFFPYFFGASAFALPLVPAAYSVKEKSRYPVLGAALLGDLYFSIMPFGLYTLFILCAFVWLQRVQKFLYIEKFFTLSVNVILLAFSMNVLQGFYFFTGALFLEKEFFFDPFKQGLFALFAYTLPMMALLPQEQKMLKIFSMRESSR